MADVAKSKGAFNFSSARFANKLTPRGEYRFLLSARTDGTDGFLITDKAFGTGIGNCGNYR
jgi:hypothetical protein